MTGADAFFDTNVLLYLLSAEADKTSRAEAVLADGGTVSVQVLNEFAAVATRKLGMTWPEVADILGGLRAVLQVEPLTVATHERALALATRHGFPLYDALIVAAALEAGCATLYSEDFQNGQRIDDALTVRNPFA